MISKSPARYLTAPKFYWERIAGRGLPDPELVPSARRDTLVQIQGSQSNTCFVSTNRTRELGIRQTTGKVYESFIYALEHATRFTSRAQTMS